MAIDASYERLLDRLEGFTIEDEEGEPRMFRGLPGLSMEEVVEWERKTGLKLPDDYKRFIMRWDGAEAGTFEMFPHSASVMIETGMLALHPWGNGDMDCLDLKKENYGAVVFLGRELSSRPVIAPSFADWLAGVIKELDYHGVLFHPFLDQQHGFYRKAISGSLRKTIVRLDEPGDWIYWLCMKLFQTRHGTLTWRHKSGGKKKEAVYRFGKLRKETSWHENGNKSSETFFLSEEVADGLQTTWHPNGRVHIQRTFVKGHLQGLESQWNAEGDILSEKVWELSKLAKETVFNRYANTVEETLYTEKDGKRAATEVRKRKMSGPGSEGNPS